MLYVEADMLKLLFCVVEADLLKLLFCVVEADLLKSLFCVVEADMLKSLFCVVEADMLKSLATALVDFADLNCLTALQLLLEGVNDTKTISAEQMSRLVDNLAAYLDFISLEGNTSTWSAILNHFDTFLRLASTMKRHLQPL